MIAALLILLTLAAMGYVIYLLVKDTRDEIKDLNKWEDR